VPPGKEQRSISARQQLRDLVDQIPEDQVHTAYRILFALTADPVLLSLLTAPPDDEPYTEEQQRRDLETLERHRRGDSIPHEQVLKEFGL
jgi:hypothetical protein